MENQHILYSKQYLEELYQMRVAQSERAKQLAKYKDVRLERKLSTTGNWHYSALNKGSKACSYLGSAENEVVNSIKELRYLDISLKLINENIEMLEKHVAKINRTDYESVNAKLPKTYKEPMLKMAYSDKNKELRKWKKEAEARKAMYDIYRPEELIHKTDDGSFVRSKSEALIYNYLLSAGVTFAYELPMSLRGRRVFPDFTICSEIDFENIIIEHQGMMSNDYYRDRFNDKLFAYLQNGYVQGINIFFTFDYINGGFDKTPIEDIVRCRVKPDALKQ